jgi:Alcohol dehydrogenase GroES-like domain
VKYFCEHQESRRQHRSVVLTKRALRELRNHRSLETERQASSAKWQNTGFVFTNRWGGPLHQCPVQALTRAPDDARPDDVIARIDTATICGTDLHILKSDVAECKPGLVLGHEAVGTVVETRSAVTVFQIGDRVLVSCVSACGRCSFCKVGRYGQCSSGGGWIFGHLINGLQAEYARVAFADTSIVVLQGEGATGARANEVSARVAS